MRQFDNKTIGYAERRRNNHLIALSPYCLIIILFFISEAKAEVADTLATKSYVEGVRLSAERQYADAMKNFEAAVAREPLHAPSMYEMASIWAAAGYPGRALEFSTKALELDPDNVWYKRLAGRLMVAFGQYEKALPLYEDLARSGHDLEMLVTLSSLYFEAGRLDEAIETGENALALASDNAVIINNLAYYMSEAGRDLERALELSSQAVEIGPDEPTFLDTHAWVLYKLGDYAEAKRIMTRALPLDRTNNPELLFHYGEVLWALDEDFLAKTYWKRALEAGYKPAEEVEERLKRTR